MNRSQFITAALPIIIAAVYLYLINRAMNYFKMTFPQIMAAHVWCLLPRWLLSIQRYHKIYNDPELFKIAKQYAYKIVRQLYARNYAVYGGTAVWLGLYVYGRLRPELSWPEYIFSELWYIPVGAIWLLGTFRANVWANQTLTKTPSRIIMEWGELFRKKMLTNPLQVKLVEKYWYICALRTAMAHTAEAGSGFGLAKTPDGILMVDSSRLPEIVHFGEGKLKVNLQGFPINYEGFSQYAYRKLLPYTKFRTISMSKAGENSVVNWEIDHNDLPSGDLAYSTAPKEVIEDEPVLGWTGRNFYKVQLKKFPHILVAGNTRMGKSTFYNNLIASLHPNTIILIADPKKDALDFRWLMRDPYGLAELRRMRAGQHDGTIPDFMRERYRDKYVDEKGNIGYKTAAWVEYLYKNPELDSDAYYYYKNLLFAIPSVVVADSMNRTKRMAQWLWDEFLRRKEICANNDLKNIELTRDKDWFKNPEYIPRIVFMMDESAAFQISSAKFTNGKKSKDDLATLINNIMNDEVFLGGALKMSIVEATQRPSAKIIGEDIRPQFLGISFYTKGSHYEMMFGKDSTVDVPPPGEDGAYYGTFVAENQTGGYTYVKAFKSDEIEVAKHVWDRANKPGNLPEQTFHRWQNAWERVFGAGDEFKDDPIESDDEIKNEKVVVIR